MTITEKILARASGRAAVAPGDFVEVTTDCPTVIAPHSAEEKGAGLIEEMGLSICSPASVKIVDGHLGASASHKAAEGRAFIRDWARRMTIPDANIWRLGRSGIENMIAVEQCWPLPGKCYFQGVNGHISTAGALGAFASALSYETAAYLVRNKTWAKVPPTIRVVVSGQPKPGVLPRDVSETLLDLIGPTGAVGAVLEWTGEYITSLPMEGRFSICSQALFSGAWTAIVNPDEQTSAYVSARSDEPFEPLSSDLDATFAGTIDIDVSTIEPKVVVPPTRHTIVDVADVVGTPITKGFIGSDAGGWLPDLRIAAEILRGRTIHPSIVLNVTPGTVEILKGALREGILEVLLDAGCVVPTPNEGMEWGGNTPLEVGDVCIATGQTNYPGRMGSRDASIYLGNAAVVAASAIRGEITDPREYLQ